jgi:aminoglycoside phosphotransferase (APT) family kinase protein
VEQLGPSFLVYNHDNGRVLRTDGIHHIEPVTGGFATRIWRIETGQRRYALRAFRPDQIGTLRREWSVLRTAHGAGLPVPAVRALGTYDKSPAMLIDWCPGRTLLAALEAEPWRLLQLGRAFGRLQKRMHAIRAPSDLRGGWIDWPRTADAHVASRLRSLPLLADRLLHLDYHPLNVLFEAGQVTAVLDWTNAHAGDPRADLARTLSILRLAPPLGDVAQTIARRALELGWRSGYGSFGPQMAPFYAWAGGAMLHDLIGRVSPAELEPARRWTAQWTRQLG